MTPDLLFGLLSAIANAVGSVLSKGLATRFPARQLIGPLFALNCLVVLPFAPFAAWIWSPAIVALHLASVGLIVLTALSVWDLYDHGAASATVTAQSISPLPAALAVAVLLPGTLEPLQVVAAVVVVFGVLGALSNAFGPLGAVRSVLTVLVAAVGTGLVTVMGRLLADQGVGVVEAYVVRTALAAAIFLVGWPPREIPLRELPRLGIRSVFISAHFLLILIAVQDGNPAVVQTAVATTPLLVLGWESFQGRAGPTRRALLASLVALAGVAVIFLAP